MKNTMIFKTVAAAVAALAFSGCAAITGESDAASQNLGWVYASGDGVKTLIVIDLDSGRNVDLSDKDEIKKLQNSKKFKFYEFGGGILESVVYSA